MSKDIQRDPFYILPDEIINAILVCLPIRDAVRTSILSSNWRFKWHTMSKLVFDNRCLPPLTDGGNRVGNLMNIVDSVLTLHVGPIQIFKLSAHWSSVSDVDRWITLLSRNQIKEISLWFNFGAPYRAPSHLFSFEALTCLELRHCVVKLPPSFQKFSKLTFLTLVDVRDPEGRLKALISGCPSLRRLTLVNIVGLNHLNVTSPNLREVYFYGGIHSVDLSFGHAPYLSRASFWFSGKDHGEKTKSANLLDGLPNIQKLKLLGSAIKRFRSYRNMQQRPPRYDHLKCLCINLDFQSRKDFKTLFCLFRSFSNLEVLNIQVASSVRAAASTSSSTNSWKLEDFCVTFTRLKRVKISGMIGTKQELLLIECLLGKAPLLETITISTYNEKRVIAVSEILEELMHNQRASAKAKIIHTREIPYKNLLRDFLSFE